MSLDTKEDVWEMLNLRSAGNTYRYLRERFEVGTGRISYLCGLYGVVVDVKMPENLSITDIKKTCRSLKTEDIIEEIKEIKVKMIKGHKYGSILYENTNMGKDYKDYIRDAGMKIPKITHDRIRLD